jgi:predicted site-specific integrase-resolvase
MSDPAPPPQLLLGPRRAAQALSVSPRTLWTWTKRGDVPCVRCGRLVRYRVIDLERFAAEHLTDTLAAGVQP